MPAVLNPEVNDLAVLTHVAGRLQGEPALRSVLGRSTAVLSVPESARAMVIAGLATTSKRRPILVAVPNNADATWLANDLGVWLGPDAVDLYPAWETLPFERVSPSVETMGRRLRTMWRLQDPDNAPAVIVAPVRALLQRLGPHVEEAEPIRIGHGDAVDQAQLVEQLVAMGYRREFQVEHRGEMAVRGSIVDVFPSTAFEPIRIDLWGDEVDSPDSRSAINGRLAMSRKSSSSGVGNSCRPTRSGNVPPR